MQGEIEWTTHPDSDLLLDKVVAVLDDLAELLGNYHSDSDSVTTSNVVLLAWHEYLSTCTTRQAKHDAVAHWPQSLPIASNPKIDDLLVTPLAQLLNHVKLSGIGLSERGPLVSAPGTVLLRLVAIQHDLGEPVTVDGALLEDIIADRVVPAHSNVQRALEVMWSATDPFTHLNGSHPQGLFQELAQRRLTFNKEHIVYTNVPTPRYLRMDSESANAPSADDIAAIPGPDAASPAMPTKKTRMKRERKETVVSERVLRPRK